MSERRISGKAIVTGASGLVGGRLRDALLDASVDVVAIRRAGSPPASRGRSAEIDYSDPESLASLFEREKPDWVFHVAGVMNGVRYDDFYQGNVVPTRNLLRALRGDRQQLRRFVYVSSLTAYGPSQTGSPMREDAELNPIEFYGRSKLETEEVIRAEGDGIPWTILRPGGIYGPRDRQYFELFRFAARGINPFYGNRKREMSMVHVDDLVDAIIDAAQSPATVYKGYFICDGHPVTWEELQKEIVKVVGRKVWDVDFPGFAVHLLASLGDIKGRITGKPSLYNRQKVIMGIQDAWTCKHDSAREDFGYQPKIPLEKGIQATYEWYRANGWL
ncbi:MAG: NAD(P)-dependent oxidoreductase [Deltaproteobacteria bacterium]|nr:NAD(P)-dependent oxidoreductase [Deltaproteobacteria bacterium]